MRRLLVAFLTLTVLSLATGVPADAAKKPKSVTVSQTDPRGDQLAWSGTADPSFTFGIRGQMTPVPMPAATHGIDLLKVTYRVERRAKAGPALSVSVRAHGPFVATGDRTSPTWTRDVLVLAIGTRLSLIAGSFGTTALEKNNGTVLRCPGLSGGVVPGRSSATIRIPLSCFTAAKVKSASIVTGLLREVATAGTTVTVHDSAAASPKLPLTPLR